MPLVQNIQAGGNVLTEADVAAALGNWVSIVGVAGATVIPPNNQTTPASTVVAGIAFMPTQSGILDVRCKASYSGNTTASLITHKVITKQGATSGAVTGGTAAAKISTGAPGLNAGIPTFLGSAGQVLNVDAAGGAGLQFEGANLAATGITQSQDRVGTLTGLLTANGQGTNNFEFVGMCDNNGPGSLVKLPFTNLLPLFVGLQLTATLGVIAYDSLSLFITEMPQR